MALESSSVPSSPLADGLVGTREVEVARRINTKITMGAGCIGDDVLGPARGYTLPNQRYGTSGVGSPGAILIDAANDV